MFLYVCNIGRKRTNELRVVLIERTDMDERRKINAKGAEDDLTIKIDSKLTVLANRCVCMCVCVCSTVKKKGNTGQPLYRPDEQLD